MFGIMWYLVPCMLGVECSERKIRKEESCVCFSSSFSILQRFERHEKIQKHCHGFVCDQKVNTCLVKLLQKKGNNVHLG
jgi:hypothetical protein